MEGSQAGREMVLYFGLASLTALILFKNPQALGESKGGEGHMEGGWGTLPALMTSASLSPTAKLLGWSCRLKTQPD